MQSYRVCENRGGRKAVWYKDSSRTADEQSAFAGKALHHVFHSSHQDVLPSSVIALVEQCVVPHGRATKTRGVLDLMTKACIREA